jgi:TatA/E family protein of Tat protein translocase
VFGAGKLPSVLGDIGKGLRVFKKEVKELDEDDK